MVICGDTDVTTGKIWGTNAGVNPNAKYLVSK